jgi:hypothetical protein
VHIRHQTPSNERRKKKIENLKNVVALKNKKNMCGPEIPKKSKEDRSMQRQVPWALVTGHQDRCFDPPVNTFPGYVIIIIFINSLPTWST